MDELQRAMRRSLEDLKKWLSFTKPWSKTHFWCAAVIVLQCLLWITMLLSDQPRAVLEPECDRAQLQAEVESLKEQLGAVKKEMEKERMESDRQLVATNRTLRKTKMDLEKAIKGSSDLQTQLAAANQSLGETQQRWMSCQAQLDSTKGKTASLEKERNNLQPGEPEAPRGRLCTPLGDRDKLCTALQADWFIQGNSAPHGQLDAVPTNERRIPGNGLSCQRN
uniref:uncharacterized protein LOC114588683 n=1 Tax=Podarcis muralis TaxID=64176 RepID=UPI0010A00921|nr:uncharacterized protein LOC114588683 [Podarcis muralis]